jgi:TM2 domain-containing membrane protein YozV
MLPSHSRQPQLISDKSYGVAVCLSGVFGILGIHHFYLERWLHGIFDLGLSVVGFSLIFFSNDASLGMLGVVLLVVDGIHTIYVTYKLLVGEYRDGQGLIVAYPGQFKYS